MPCYKSSPSSAEDKNAWSYTSTHPIHLHGVGLVKHRDNFTFKCMTLSIAIMVIPDM